jgi:hypothetical protein
MNMDIMKRIINHLLVERSLLVVLFTSGLIGGCIGLYNATWQYSVEMGQMLAGIVRYPVENPNYMNNVKVFTIVNQISAILLYFLDSEKAASILISGLLGVVSFQAISVFIFALNRNVAISILGTIFIFLSTYDYYGVIYPIWLLGTPLTFGILGLSFTVLVIALIGAKAYRLGLFCLGLAPSVHPSLGIWLYLIIFIASLFQRGFLKNMVKANYLCFFSGLAISFLSFAYQIHIMHILPLTTSEAADQLYYNYIKYWDHHRVKFYLDYATQQINFLKPGVIVCFYSILVSLMCTIYFKDKESISFVAKLIAVSGVSSLLLGGMTHISPENQPIPLLMLMPGRYVNINNILFGALLLGILTYRENQPSKINKCVFLLFLVGNFFPFHLKILDIFVVMLWFAYLSLKDYSFIQKNLSCFNCVISNERNRILSFLTKGTRFVFIQKKTVSYVSLIISGIVIYMFTIIVSHAYYGQPFLKQYDFKDWRSDAFYSIVSEKKGFLLITSDFSLISLITRRPILVDPSAIDYFAMVPESGGALDNILRKVYGVSFLIPPPLSLQHSGEIPSELHRELWEKRTIGSWQDLRAEFNITGVLTKSDWKLLLPVAARNEEMTLYEIPDI